MYRIDHSTAAPALPTPSAAGTAGFFTAGNATAGTPATVVTAEFLNQVQEEMVSVIAAAGITPSKTANNQLLTALSQLYVPATPAARRTRLSSNLPVYVATTGSDSNNGLTSGSPFLTIQKAWNHVRDNYDLNGFNVTINVAAGTYTGGLIASGYPVGYGSVTLAGASTASPASTVISVTNATAILAVQTGLLYVQGLKLTATGTQSTWSSGGCCILCSGQNATVYPSYLDYGAAGYAHLYAANSGIIAVPSTGPNQIPFTISGDATIHALAADGGRVAIVGANTTMSGTRNFTSAFAFASAGEVTIVLSTFSGAATGQRWSAVNLGLLATNGGYTSLPGSLAGGTAQGGVAY